ncbi:MAG: thrombospondin type 3 repeat-containing protein [Epsilonproteobacteria bacterium]|nr:thrombospondin type 3 repeat-containing protein [Campylobacterota bacterium]
MQTLLKTSLVSLIASAYILSFTGCVSDRANFGNDLNTSGGGVVLDPNGDEDNDGITNGDEDAIGTDPVDPDSDNDGLDDGLEHTIIGTSPLSDDTDKDGVTDGIEVVGTYIDNIDAEGKVTTAGASKAAIKDGVLDLETPITIADWGDRTPANIHINAFTDPSDAIDALDPMNDSDYDTKQNATEKSDGTDPLDQKDRAKWIYEVEPGLTLIENGFTYIPGGFDLDGDGEKETGFWMAQYEARAGIDTVVADIDNFGLYVNDKFNITNDTSMIGYITGIPGDSGTDLSSAQFTDQSVQSPMSGMYGFEAAVILENSQVSDQALSIKLPSIKQYVQTRKLVNQNVNTPTLVKNSTLGYDANAAESYNTNVYELFGSVKEFTSSTVALANFSAPAWWGIVNTTKNSVDLAGAGIYVRTTQSGIGYEQDPYAVIVSDGNDIDIRYGVAFGEASRIGFRAATDYLAQ